MNEDVRQELLSSSSHPGSGPETREGTGYHRVSFLPRDLLEFARSLRRQHTDAESLLWGLLRNRRLAGAKFRRQHPIPPYIVDFYCHEARLVIEADGGQHSEQRRYDAERTAFLEECGLKVLRFWNHEILEETEGVLEAIWQALISRKGGRPSP